MKSLPISKFKNEGFTLIEIVVVMSLIALLGSLGIYFGLDNFRGHSFHSDRDTLISALEHARAEAVSNACSGTCTNGKPHGVFIDTVNHKYIIFQGTSYANHLITNDKDYDIPITGNQTTTYKGINEVVFAQLSGSASSTSSSSFCSAGIPLCIILSDNTIHTSEIDINNEGQILWTN
jgi:prepilin-type N-terminal cleavage/methylation domain-containing protein